MTVTITGPVGDVLLDGTGSISTALVDTTDTEVWITEVGGPRICQVPLGDAVKAQWSETLGPMPSSSATLNVDRYALLDAEDPASWVVAELRCSRDRAPREVQIVHQGRVVFWGPVVSTGRKPGEATVDVSCSGSEYWFGFRLVTNVEEDVFGVEQIRPPAVFDPPLDLGGTSWEWGRTLWFERSDWRFTARVLVDAAVDDAEPILVLNVAGGATIPGQGQTVYAGQLSRDVWTTAVIQMSLEAGGVGSLGQAMTLRVAGEGAGAGEVLVEEVTAQVSPTSVGLDEMSTPEARFYFARESWLEIVGYVSDLGFVGWAESQGTSSQTAWKRPDVFAVEAGRQLTEGGGSEIAIALTETLRIAQLWDLRGVEHDPEVLTLEAGSTVVEWGSWQTGLGRPVTEWIVANDEGFTGSYHDTAALGGLRLQEYVAAPTGSHAAGLAYRARFAASQAASTYSEQLPATVPMALESTLNIGDRVWGIVDDGPDQWDDWLRVMSKTVVAGAAAFDVALVPWVAP